MRYESDGVPHIATRVRRTLSGPATYFRHKNSPYYTDAWEIVIGGIPVGRITGKDPTDRVERNSLIPGDLLSVGIIVSIFCW